MTALIKGLIPLLNKEKLYAWKVTSNFTTKEALYLSKNFDYENYSSGAKEETLLTVYKKKGKKIGEAAVSIIAGDNIKKTIRDASYLASLSLNPFYEPFASYNCYPPKPKKDKFFMQDTYEKSLSAMMNIIKKEAKKNKNIRLSQGECILSNSEISLHTSNGDMLSTERTYTYLESVFIARKLGREQEMLGAVEESSPSKINIKLFAKSYIKYAIDSVNAVKPQEYEGKVMLYGEALKEFFVPELNENPLVLHASARMKYLGVSRYKKGKQILRRFDGEKVSIISDALLRGGYRSACFDGNGVPAQKSELIKKGVFNNYIASKQYADYLKIKPAGPLGNIVVTNGKTQLSHLKRQCHVEIVSFASFVPNPFSGDFTAEIRLGYIHKDGKRIPFRGGMLVGNCFEMMKDAHFSKERVQASGYYGPRAAVFGNLKVASL